MTKNEALMLAFRLGVPVHDVATHDMYQQWTIKIHPLIMGARTPLDLALIVEASLMEVSVFAKVGKMWKDLINNSNCGIRLERVGDEWLTYPAGEKKLDEELVEEALGFLKDEALAEYVRALKHFAESNWEECSEKTRRALEEYLRMRLKSKKGLESLIKDLSARIKGTTVPDHLRQAVSDNLRTLDRLYNESSKHNSKTYGDTECEYLIYQSALLMRLLDKVSLL